MKAAGPASTCHVRSVGELLRRCQCGGGGARRPRRLQFRLARGPTEGTAPADGRRDRQAAPGKPVVLVRGGHEYILNTTALKKWNVTKDTPVPAGGQISRNEAGELTGELFDEAKGW